MGSEMCIRDSIYAECVLECMANKKRSKPRKHFINTYQYTIDNGTNYTDYVDGLGSRLLGFTSVGRNLHIHSSRSPLLVIERRVRAD